MLHIFEEINGNLFAIFVAIVSLLPIFNNYFLSQGNQKNIRSASKILFGSSTKLTNDSKKVILNGNSFG